MQKRKSSSEWELRTRWRKRLFEAIVAEPDKTGLAELLLNKQVAAGLCYAEPSVEVKMDNVPDTIYGKVTAEIGRKIVTEHILQGKMVSELGLINQRLTSLKRENNRNGI